MAEAELLEETRKKISSGQTFGSFYAGNEEFLIDATYLQEVVNFPEMVNKMPLAPEYLLGIFNLRGMIIPIICIRKKLAIKTDCEQVMPKIAIILKDGVRVGLLFDKTGDVIRLKNSDISNFSYEEGSEEEIVNGALSMNEGKRLLQFIDINSVIKIKNIPQINSIAENRSQKVVNLNKLNLNINKCISFDVNNIKLAIDINKISEIIEVDEITHSALESNLCMGMTSLRGKFIPLVDFSYVLEGVQRDWENKKIKVIVLSIKNNNIGVIVDRVVGINTFNSDDIMSLPVFSNQRASMFSGCIQTDLGDTFLIDSAELFSQTELGEISKGHNKIYEEDSAEDQQKKSNLTKKTYISFKLNYLLGISINDIKEIIEYPKEILNTPGLPSFALGLYNLRDSLVTIIDTRKLYQLSDEQSITDKKVLIIEKDTNLYGLVVDSIHSIHIIYEDSSMKLPDLLSREVSKDFSQDVQEVIKLKAEAEDDTDKALVVLDTNSLIRNIQNSKAS